MSSRGWEGLPDISKALYEETYFQPGENYQAWVEKITNKYSNDAKHALRMEKYIKNYWFHPSTPIASDRGLPISCYVSHIADTRESIFEGYFEGSWLGALGGGRGVTWSEVGGAGRPISTGGHSSGTIPFLGISDRATYGISQAGVRRSTEAAYLRVDHPDILDFIDIRLETGDPNRRTPNLHHGVVIPDAFMEAVRNLQPWDLICPHTGDVTDTIDAYDLWIDILETRKTETGEPYLLFIDTVNNQLPPEYGELGLKVSSSNICTEIVLHTDPDTSAVCCLGSLNLEFWDEILPELDQVVADCTDFLDNVLDVFLAETAEFTGMKAEAFKRVRKSVMESRDIGLGTMGLHTLFQKSNLPFESPMAKGLNIKIFQLIREASDRHQASLPDSSICPISLKAGTHRRNIHTIAIAPTMSISNLCNLSSSGIEPWVSNAFSKKLIQGTFPIRNKYLDDVIIRNSTAFAQGATTPQNWIAEQWQSIIKHGGSVQHLEWMDPYTKDVFKTAFEIDQRAVIGLAGDRAPYIDQSQSVNIFLPAECSYEELHTIHFMAWELGNKSLYYLRSEPETTADTSNKERKAITLENDVCISCT